MWGPRLNDPPLSAALASQQYPKKRTLEFFLLNYKVQTQRILNLILIG